MQLVLYRSDLDTFYLGIKNEGNISWDYNNPYSFGWIKRWGFITEIPIGEENIIEYKQ